MKYRVLTIIAILLVLCTVMLSGCKKDEQGTPSLYWNLDRGAERIPESDGSYKVAFMLDGEQVTLRVPNEELMKKIDFQHALGLEVDKNGNVTSMTGIADMPQYFVALNYSVQSIGGKVVKVNSSSTFNARSLVVTFDENTKILDISDYAAVKGTPTALQKGDGISIVANGDGTVNTIFVVRREGEFTTEMRYCELCKEEVEFTNWFSSASLPFSSGHYYLEKDISMGMSTTIANAEITLDLNGKTITMIKEGQRFYTVSDEATLNVIDSVGSGKAVVASAGKGTYDSGLFVQTAGFRSTFNMYSGTIDATDCIADCGCIVDNLDGVFNMYGGTFLGGTTYGVGGGAIIVQSEVNIYGGEIIGGDCSDMPGLKSNPPGGGCIRHNGKIKALNIYGGVIKGGSTDYNGGCIYINGPLKLYGGTITGGSAAQAGGGIYMAEYGSIDLKGDAVVADNEGSDIYLSNEAAITINEEGLGDAKIGIAMADPGKFTLNAVAQDKVSCFFASNGGKISRNGDGTLSLK